MGFWHVSEWDRHLQSHQWDKLIFLKTNLCSKHSGFKTSDVFGASDKAIMMVLKTKDGANMMPSMLGGVTGLG